MRLGEAIVYATAWGAMACYGASLAVRARSTVAGTHPWERRLWTLGCVAYLLHVAAAFQFVHGWSHAAAAESTARRTAETTGRASAAGIYFNYAFTLVWLLDAAWWNLAPHGYAGRSRLVSLPIRGFLFFMAFNAVVVFGRGGTRLAGIAFCAVLLAAWLRRRY